MRNVMRLLAAGAAIAALVPAAAGATVVTTASTDAAALAGSLGGSGVTISNAALNGDVPNGAGTFTGGTSAGVGFDTGIILATGDIANAAGPNSAPSTSGSGVTTTLTFDFTTDTGNVFFSYVFASEEYEEYVHSQFNDGFNLLINGVNVALIPSTTTPVTINNVNQFDNTAYYRSNTAGAFDIEYDGLTVVLLASATGLSTTGTNTAEFTIFDVGDESYDSAVFIQAGTFQSEPPPTDEVPEPAALGLLGLGMIGAGVVRRRRH